MKTDKTYMLAGSLEKAIDEVDRLLLAGGGNLVLDFGAATFVSVEALEWLEELIMRAGSAQVKVAFVNVPPTIYKVFKVAHIDSLLEACGALARSGPAC